MFVIDAKTAELIHEVARLKALNESLAERVAKQSELLSRKAERSQPAPQANSLPAVWDLVLADMVARDKQGEAKYGVRLQPGNGRNNLLDAYQEALDLAVYLRAAIYERDGLF